MTAAMLLRILGAKAALNNLGDLLQQNYPRYQALTKGPGTAPLLGGIFFPRVLLRTMKTIGSGK